MAYQIKNNETDKVVATTYCHEEVDYLIQEFGEYEHYVHEAVSCRKCDNEGDERTDAYGISTGYWCEGCYNGTNYPYRRDRYPTVENDGYGENLDY